MGDINTTVSTIPSPKRPATPATDDGLRRSKRTKIKAPRYDSDSDLTPPSEVDSGLASSSTVVVGKDAKGSKGKSAKRKGKSAKSKSVQFKTPTPAPPSPMSPGQTASLARLADTMEGPKYWNYTTPTPEAHAAEINSGLLELIGCMTRLGSILDQVVGHLGIQCDAGPEEKAAAILKHLQDRK